MSELEERLRRDARDNCVVRAHVYARDVVKLLDERDKTIAEQRAVIAELSNEPITEFETLRQAHDAQNAVLSKMWAELVALRAENGALCDALRKTQAELASAKLGIQ